MALSFGMYEKNQSSKNGDVFFNNSIWYIRTDNELDMSVLVKL